MEADELNELWTMLTKRTFFELTAKVKLKCT